MKKMKEKKQRAGKQENKGKRKRKKGKGKKEGTHYIIYKREKGMEKGNTRERKSNERSQMRRTLEQVAGTGILFYKKSQDKGRMTEASVSTAERKGISRRLKPFQSLSETVSVAD